MTLFDKSLQVLELPVVLDLLAQEAVSSGAKDMALALRPLTDIRAAETALSETSAAKNMMTLRQCPPFSGVKDVRAFVKRAGMGGTLNTRELLDVAELLRSAASSVSYFTHDKNTQDTAIDYLFSALRPNKYLQEKIQSAIISEDEISDNASAALADIRRHIRLAGDRIRQTLSKLITSQAYSKVLQEPIITMRNNRYVVPVKAEQKSNVPGMVHDISSSGATHFIEPMAVVNLNNELRELAAEEKDEIDRILMELSADVAQSAESIVCNFEILTGLDFVFAKAKLSYAMDAAQTELSGDRLIKLEGARHPLLPKGTAVPVDVRLGGQFDTLVITGPNTGGKTVTLKTLGLLCAMAACGLHIPAKYGSTVPVFKKILADIGDEQSIEQSLSTFSSHMTNIIGILDECTADSLLLFDELGAGTDPVEGAALAISIIEHARASKALIAATTHYAELKEYALTSKGVINASCEFDVETLKPTYKLIIGIPGKSNAFAISRQLGLSGKIINAAKSRVSTENATFEETLQGLEELRLELEREKDEASKLRRDAETAMQKAAELKASLEREREKHTATAKREASAIIEQARQTAREVSDEISKLRKKAAKNADWQSLNDEKANLLRRLNEADNALHPPAAPAAGKGSQTDEINPGNRVKLLNLGTQADVISVGKDGTLTLQAGIMKITAHRDEVSLVDTKEHIEIRQQKNKSEAKLREANTKPELDIRGMTSDEALPIMEQFIHNAKMSKLNSVTIIHGKGTGALRKAVHRSLKHDGHGIKSYRLGVFGEGESGVTIVEL